MYLFPLLIGAWLCASVLIGVWLCASVLIGVWLCASVLIGAWLCASVLIGAWLSASSTTFKPGEKRGHVSSSDFHLILLWSCTVHHQIWTRDSSCITASKTQFWSMSAISDFYLMRSQLAVSTVLIDYHKSWSYLRRGFSTLALFILYGGWEESFHFLSGFLCNHFENRAHVTLNWGISNCYVPPWGVVVLQIGVGCSITNI